VYQTDISRLQDGSAVIAAGLCPRRPGFVSRSVHVSFVVDRVSVGQAFLRVILFLSCQCHSANVPNSSSTLLLLLFIYLFIHLFIYLFTAIQFSLSGSSPYTSTDKTNKNKYTWTKEYINTVQTVQNTINTSTCITETPTQLLKQPNFTTHTKWNIHNTAKYIQYKVTLMYMVLLCPIT
jgi:hypothetical protein